MQGRVQRRRAEETMSSAEARRAARVERRRQERRQRSDSAESWATDLAPEGQRGGGYRSGGYPARRHGGTQNGAQYSGAQYSGAGYGGDGEYGGGGEYGADPAGGHHGHGGGSYQRAADQRGGPGGRVYGGQAAPGLDGPDDEGPVTGRRRDPRWAKLLVAAGAALMLLSGLVIVGGNLMVDRYAGNVQQENLLGGAAAEGKALDGPINLLLLGLDAREPDSEDVRSDTILVLHVPATHDQAYLISVPRDTWVNVPAYEPSGYWGGEAKITEAFYFGFQNGGGWNGGAQLVAMTLHELTGLRFNGAAIVNFSGFRKIIDEIGGVEYCVDTPAYSEHLVLVNGEPMGIAKAQREGHQYQQVRYETGCQRLEGWQALDYARQRKTLESEEGDYGRQRHQQMLLKAMAKEATSTGVLTNPSKLDGLLLGVGDALILDTNSVPIVDFVFTLKGLAANDMVSLRTNDGWYNSAQINGVSAEVLSPESLEMFRAAANDTMAQFVLTHPDFVNAEGEAR